MSKVVFFDIDNTLWDFHMVIPESAAEAVRKLRENGHLAFLCTGRARGNLISEELVSLPFNGIIASCGNHIEVDGEVIHEYLLPDDILERCVDVIKRCHLPSVLEGPEDHWIDEEGFDGDPYVDYLHDKLGEHALPLRGFEKGMKVNKISSLTLPITDLNAIRSELAEDLDFIVHLERVVEIVPKGTSKATGIRTLCAYLGIPMEDTYALGDSSNDLDMLECVGHSIAMGNAQAHVKEIAEYVTTDIHDDGVWNALKHYGLI